MLGEQPRFKTETFTIEDQQYLYQLQNNAQNSIIKIYNNEGKLRSAQRARLPANCSIYPCEHYLLVFDGNQIQLREVPNLNAKLTCANPGIQGVLAACYNRSANLIFVLTSANQIFYILPQIGSIKAKKIFDCKKQGINGRITKLEVDSRSLIHLLCTENQTVYTLKFDWNKNDSLKNMTKKQHVLDIYYRGDWSLLALNDRDDNNISIYIQDASALGGRIMQHLDMEHNGNGFKNVVPGFGENERPIIKSSKNHLLYLDVVSKNAILISNKQQLYVKDITAVPPKSCNPSTLLFQIQKKSYNLLHLRLHTYIGLGQPFTTTQIPMNILSEEDNVDDEESILLYIHNNIHLILTHKGIQRHFQAKAKEYVGETGNVDGETLTVLLLEKLFEESPMTTSKLANHFRKQSATLYLPSQLSRYLLYLTHILTKLPYIHIHQSQPPYTEAQIQHFLSSIDPKQQTEYYRTYKRNQAKLQNMITFASLIWDAIRDEEMNGENRMQLLGGRGMDEEGDGTIAGGDFYKYYQIVGRCKSVYLLNEIYYWCVKQQIRDSAGSVVMERQSNIGSDILASIIKPQQINVQQSSTPKIGPKACHQLFHNLLPSKPNVKQVIGYLARCDNFYHAAYFYLYLDCQEKEIPYVADADVVDMVRFIVDSPAHVLADRQELKRIYKCLPKFVGKALLLNQPTFLQYLCALSINSSQYKSCLSIILSSAHKEWPARLHPFIIQCLILCDRTLLAYRNVQALAGRNKEHYRDLMEELIAGCIRERKIRDLLEISVDGDTEQDIQKRLEGEFGNDAKEIIGLMHQLNTHQE